MKTSKVEHKPQALRQKHVTERTCIACRAAKGKRELVRLVCSTSVIEVDPKGKKPGRGVYLCPYRKCWELSLKSNRIEYGLHTKLSTENRQSLLEYGRSLPEREE
jgi:predicted RNA-binding protein YlxR (DUF448 family)